MALARWASSVLRSTHAAGLASVLLGLRRGKAWQHDRYCGCQAMVPDMRIDQLTPVQTKELRSPIGKQNDQISWTPYGIACLSEEYKDLYLTILTVEGVKWAQRRHRLCYTELARCTHLSSC